MPMFKKVALFGAVVASYVYADDVEAEDLDDLDNEDSGAEKKMPDLSSLGLPEDFDLSQLNLPEGMNIEDLLQGQGLGGGEGAGNQQPEGAPAKPELHLVESAEELEKGLAERPASNAVYVFSGAEDSKAHEVAKQLVEVQELFAAVVFQKIGATEGEEVVPSKLTLYKGAEEVVEYSGDFEEFETVKSWAMEKRIPAFGQIDDTNFEIYVEAAKTGMFWTCFDPSKQNEQVTKFSAALVAASEQQNKFPFVYVDAEKFADHVKEELGCKEFPTIVLQKGNLMAETEEEMLQIEKFIRSFANKEEEFTTEAVSQFFADVESGVLKAEPVPDPLDALDDDDDEEEDEPETVSKESDSVEEAKEEESVVEDEHKKEEL